MRKRTHYERNVKLNMYCNFYWDVKTTSRVGIGHYSYYLPLNLTGQEMVQRRDEFRR